MQIRRAVTVFLVAMTMAVTTLQTAGAALPGLTDDEGRPTLAPMIEEASPAVVNISTRGSMEVESNPLMNDPFFRRFFGLPEQGQPPARQFQSLGSGVIVDAEKGYVLTNHHVIENADEVRVSLQDKREFDAEVIGSDPETDIAVIRIPAENLKALPMADSDQLRVGDYAVAIGNPFGLDHTVTSGIISGLGRQLQGGAVDARLQNFIQTDASINPGNSGGALVNLEGELIGINTAILSRSGGNIGIGFAVPINMARQVMTQLIEYGEVRRGVLGVNVQNLTAEIAEALGIDRRSGALVARVIPGSSADKAGIRQGDVVTSVNGEPVQSASDLANAIGLMSVGDEVSLEIIRDGEARTIDAVVGKAEQVASGDAASVSESLAGATFGPLTQESPLYGQVEGVLVTGVEPGSPASRYLRPGDVITSVNRKAVTSVDELRQAVADQDTLVLNVRRGDGAMFVVVK